MVQEDLKGHGANCTRSSHHRVEKDQLKREYGAKKSDLIQEHKYIARKRNN